MQADNGGKTRIKAHLGAYSLTAVRGKRGIAAWFESMPAGKDAGMRGLSQKHKNSGDPQNGRRPDWNWIVLYRVGRETSTGGVALDG